jgi:hypothetical protein
MTIFIVDITKQHSVNLMEWGNRYLVRATDLTEAASAVPFLTDLEAGMHQATVNILQARVRVFAPGVAPYISIPIDAAGTVGETGPEMPAITTINVQVVVAGFGRPSRKFYHGFYGTSAMHLTVSQQWTDTRVNAAQSLLQTAIADLGTNATPLVDPDDQEWTDAVIVRKVFGSHQFTKQSPRPPE